MKKKINSFKDLRVWNDAMDLVVSIYAVTRTFPRDELFGLTSQMKRSSVSIPSNISEGFNRRKPRDFQRFLYIALGSCAELETQIRLSEKLRFINSPQSESLSDKLIQISRMLKRLADVQETNFNQI